MDQPSNHQLNHLLAKWAGVAVHWNDSHNEWWFDNDDCGAILAWDPLHDANQMALVKAGLRKAGHSYQIIWDTDYKYFCVHVLEKEGFDYWVGRHASEAMALALAIQAMEENHEAGK